MVLIGFNASLVLKLMTCAVRITISDVTIKRSTQDTLILISSLLMAIQKKMGITFVFVTHDQEEALSMADTVIVMDGGKTQVEVCKEIVHSLGLNIPIIGLVKDDRHRTNQIINENYEVLDVSKDSNLFLFLTRIQDEVHRYAITYHRNIKAKGSLASVLDLVPGIGEVRRKELLKKFGSLKKMKEASQEELEEVLPSDVAGQLFEYLKDLDK